MKNLLLSAKTFSSITNKGGLLSRNSPLLVTFVCEKNYITIPLQPLQSTGYLV